MKEDSNLLRRNESKDFAKEFPKEFGGIEMTPIIVTEVPGEEDFLKQDKMELQKYVVKNIIIPNYISELVSTFKWRDWWQCISRALYWISNLFLVSSAICSFLQVQLPNTTFYSLAAGICNILTFMLLNFAGDAKKESRSLSENINSFLKTIGLTVFKSPDKTFNSTLTKPGTENSKV